MSRTGQISVSRSGEWGLRARLLLLRVTVTSTLHNSKFEFLPIHRYLSAAIPLSHRHFEAKQISRSPSSGPLELDSQMDLDRSLSRGIDKALSAAPPTSSSQLPHLPVETIAEMPSTRRFYFRGPFGVQFTITTRITDKSKISLRSTKSESSVPGSNARSKKRFAHRAATGVDFDVIIGDNTSQVSSLSLLYPRDLDRFPQVCIPLCHWLDATRDRFNRTQLVVSTHRRVPIALPTRN